VTIPTPPGVPPATSEVEGPDVSNIVIDDGAPVDKMLSEKQMRLHCGEPSSRSDVHTEVGNGLRPSRLASARDILRAALPASVGVRTTQAALAILGAGWVALSGSCGFPDHSFISDDEFYGAGGGHPRDDASAGGIVTGGEGGDLAGAGTGASGGLGASGVGGGSGLGGTGALGGGGATAGNGGASGSSGSAGAGAMAGSSAGGDAGIPDAAATDGGPDTGVDGGCACSPGEECVGNTCVNIPEDCLNGVDDDGDNDVDCADAECNAGYTCAATPAGWTGPVTLWSGTPGTAPLCSGDYPNGYLSAFFDIVIPAYQCPSCTCEPTSLSSCADFRFRVRDLSDCTGSGYVTTPLAPDTCQDYAFTGVMLSAFLAHPTDAGSGQSSMYASGACQILNVPTPSFPTPTWNVEAVACGDNTPTPGGGCGASQCVPKASAPFDTALCVFRPGVFNCPPSYPNPRPDSTNPQYYETYTDGRGCSNCTCGPLDCGGAAHLYTDTACTMDATLIPLDGSCVSLPTDPTRTGNTDSRSLMYTNAGPACGDAARAVTGAVTPSSPVTVCCQ
jgi:hypothetical protein